VTSIYATIAWHGYSWFLTEVIVFIDSWPMIGHTVLYTSNQISSNLSHGKVMVLSRVFRTQVKEQSLREKMKRNVHVRLCSDSVLDIFRFLIKYLQVHI
jgi:hypothetical protein